MKCPYCGHHELKVNDSRTALDANAIRRRRECLQCNRRFTTFETVELIIQVKKRDGRYEDFREQKLIEGLEAACRHTKISFDKVRSIAASITLQLLERQIKEISTKEIGEMVMKSLESIDAIAYIRFACVYRRFKDIGELMEAIESTRTPDIASGEENGIKEVSSRAI